MTRRNTSWRLHLFVGLILAGGLAGSPAAWGVIVFPGGTGSLTGSSYLATVVAQEERTIKLSDGQRSYGKVTIWDTVTRDPDGTLNFEYTIINTTNRDFRNVHWVRVYGLGEAQTDLDFDPTVLGCVHPTTANRDPDGNDVGFADWAGGPLIRDAQTELLTIRTNAGRYCEAGQLALWVNINGNIAFGATEVFSPKGPYYTPEPATVGLIALAVPMMVLRRRVRRSE